MHGDAKDGGRGVPALSQCEREGRDDECADEGLAAAPGRDVGDDGVDEPRGGDCAAGVRLALALSSQDGVEDRADDEVAQGKEELAAQRVDDEVWDEGEGDQGGVAVRCAGIRVAEPGGCEWALCACRALRVVPLRVHDAASGVGEDGVVDVGVLYGRVGVLVGSPDEQEGPQEGSPAQPSPEPHPSLRARWGSPERDDSARWFNLRLTPRAQCSLGQLLGLLPRASLQTRKSVQPHAGLPPSSPRTPPLIAPHCFKFG